MKTFTLPLFFLCVCYLMCVLAVALDLISGVRKAKARGEYRSSRKLRLTVEKLVKYLNMLAVLTCIDAVQVLSFFILAAQSGKAFVMLPVFTGLGTIFVCFIELKSIYEKNTDKRKAEIEDTAKKIKEVLLDETNRELIKSLLEKLEK